jgi:hypothetical protein
LDVYDFREQYGKTSSEGIFGYLNSWVSKIFIVLLFVWSMAYKKHITTAIVVSLIFLLFFLSGHKSVFSGLLLILVLNFILKYENHQTRLMYSFFFFLAIATVAIDFFDTVLLGSIFVRRLLFVPAYLNFVYIDYFSTHQFAYWADGPMKAFLAYPYDTSIANVIGTYLGHPKENANTGFLATGYAQAGTLGVLLYTFVGTLFFNILNMFSRNVNNLFFMSILMVPILTLFLSSDLFTTLLTHGLMVSLLVLYLYNNKNYIVRLGRKSYRL